MRESPAQQQPIPGGTISPSPHRARESPAQHTAAHPMRNNLSFTSPGEGKSCPTHISPSQEGQSLLHLTGRGKVLPNTQQPIPGGTISPSPHRARESPSQHTAAHPRRDNLSFNLSFTSPGEGKSCPPHSSPSQEGQSLLHLTGRGKVLPNTQQPIPGGTISPSPHRVRESPAQHTAAHPRRDNLSFTSPGEGKSCPTHSSPSQEGQALLHLTG